MPLNPAIVQAILTPPPQPHSSMHPADVRIERFPDHLFPQLRSIKRHNDRFRRQKDRANTMDWQSTTIPNRPFQDPIATFGCSQYRSPRTMYKYKPPPPSTPPRLMSLPRLPSTSSSLRHDLTKDGQLVTAYYLEQAAFYKYDPAAIGPDPFATEPGEPQPAPLQIFVIAIMALITKIFGGNLGFLLAPSQTVVLWILRTIQQIRDLFGMVKTGAFVAFLLAVGVGLRLPLVEGRARGPEYTLHVVGGNGQRVPGAF